jgi:hypothetical protein
MCRCHLATIERASTIGDMKCVALDKAQNLYGVARLLLREDIFGCSKLCGVE